MVHDPLDLALLLQVPDSYPCKTPVDLQPLDEDRLADETEGGDLLQDTVVGRLVEDDGVLGLVLDLSLGPLLLLLLASSCCRCLEGMSVLKPSCFRGLIAGVEHTILSDVVLC